MVFRKDHRPEGLGSDHMEGEDKEVIIVVLTGALNLLLEALTLNGGYSHHLSSHTLSPIGNSGRLVVSHKVRCAYDCFLGCDAPKTVF